MTQKIIIDGIEYDISDGVTKLGILQQDFEFVGQIIKAKKYDITKNPPVFLEEYEYVVEQIDLDIKESLRES